MRHSIHALVAGALAAGALAAAQGGAVADVADVDPGGDFAAALDLPAGVTVSTSGTSSQMFGTTSRAFNDFPRRGGNDSYAVISTGRAIDLFNTNLPGLQPSTSFGGSPDRASMTLTVESNPSQQCLLLDVAMATEERVHTYTSNTPSDAAALRLNGQDQNFATHVGPRFFAQADVPMKPVFYSVNAIDYWHEINEEFERQPDDPDAPLLDAVTPFDHFASVDTLEVPLNVNEPALTDTVTLSIEDANNNDLDSAMMVDRVRLAPTCSSSAGASTGIYPTRNFEIVGHRGVNNILTIDLIPETDDIERYDAADNGWFSAAGAVDLRFRWYRSKGTCTSGDMDDWIPVPDADRQTYSPTILDKGKCILALVTGLRDGYRSETFPSPGTSQWKSTLPIQNGVFTSEESPTISSPGGIETVRVGDVLTSSNGVFTPRPDSYEYQWFADGFQLSGETASTFKVGAAHAGKRIRVRVTAARLNFDDLPVLSVETPAVQLLDLTSAPVPTVSGSGRVAETLTVQPGTWQPDPVALTYQWSSDGVPITGGTKATYVPTAAQVGKQLVVSVTGTKAGYKSETKQSAPVRVVNQGFSAPTPVIVGSGLVGDSLTISQGTWTPSPTTRLYQWYDDNGAISGATSSTYRPNDNQAGQHIYVEITGKLAGYVDTTVRSEPVAVGLRTFASASPVILGSPFVGSALTVNTRKESWVPVPTFTYQWFADGNEIVGATRNVFTPTGDERGKRLTVMVTGKRTGYATEVLESDPVDIDIRYFMTQAPRITGTARVDSRLTVNDGGWVPTPTATTFTWYAGTRQLGVGRSLTVPASAAGQQIKVVMAGSRTFYEPATAVAYTPRVAHGSLNAGSPRVSGSARPGKVVSGRVLWGPRPVTLRYQWYVGSKAIKGATKSSYKIAKKHRNKKIRVRVIGTKSGYTSAVRYSAFVKVAKK